MNINRVLLPVAVALKGPAIMLAKHRKIRTNRLSKAKSRRGQKSYLDGNGMVCPGITILTAVV